MIELGKIFNFVHGGNMEEEIKKAVEESIKNGTRRLRIVFREDGINRLYELERLILTDQIKMRYEEGTKAHAIQFSGTWGHESDRVFIITLGGKFNVNYFIYTMRGALESVEACEPQPKPIRAECQKN